MLLMRESWRELWQRNRGGGLLTLAFWYTLLTSMYQYLVASRLGPSLPKGLTNILTHPGTVTSLPHLSGDLWMKLILVYLTFLLIIVPFGVGGLYGGIAYALKNRPSMTNFLSFFRFGYLNFWRALAQIVLALLLVIVGLLVLAGIYIGASALGNLGAVVFVLLFLAVMVWLVGTVLYWFGLTFSGDQSPLKGLIPALKWGSGLGRVYGRVLILLVILLATLLVMTLLTAIPVLGDILMVLVVGMIIPAFLAVYALLLVQETPIA